MTQAWRLDDVRQTLVLASDGGVPAVVYWGPPLPAAEDITALSAAGLVDVTGGMLDEVSPITLSPEASGAFPGQPGLVLYRDGGPVFPSFKLQAAQHDGDDLSFRLSDAQHELTLVISFTRVGDLFAVSSTLTAASAICVHHFAAATLPAPQIGDIQHFSGRWCGEFQSHRTAWQPGVFKREARTGRSGHEHPPFAVFAENGATHTQGTVFAMHYAHSGGHIMLAEELPDGRRQVQWGHATGSYPVGTHFQSAHVMFTRSDSGLNGCATAFQRTLRDHIVTWPKPEAPRPVHYNCWEAVYFDHDLTTLKDIADRAADLGAERFVLDDGWFGRRDDDTSSLGDWTIDPRKWPDGLGPLIDHVHARGMTFGLWFEPEMVNPDSDLYRAHRDWVLGASDQMLGRQQLVLNMARQDVREYLYDKIADILSVYAIDYIKWDHNRLLPVVDAAQAEGTYALLSRLRADFPTVEIESCASGGGRIDFGILAHTQRVWLSDSNDAIERLRIQHEAALFLPMVVTGSHVGPRACHTSGRVIDMRFRAWVAAQRHMGFEMDPRALSEDEAQVLRHVTMWWKSNRVWLSKADILRLDAADPSVRAELHLAQDGHFVVFAGHYTTSSQIAPRPLRLTGLDPDRLYRVDLINRDDVTALSRGRVALKSGPQTLSGAYLMNHGITLPWTFPETMWVLQGYPVPAEA